MKTKRKIREGKNFISSVKIRNEILRLFREDRNFREKVLRFVKDDVLTKTYFNERLIDLSKELDKKLAKLRKEFDERLVKLRQESSKEFDEKLAKQSKEFDEKLLKLRQELSKEFDEKLAKQSKEFDEKLMKMVNALTRSFDDKMMALGGRWGTSAEFAFREGMKVVLEKEFGWKIERWQHKGIIKEVHPRREEYELDVVIKNEKVIVIEMKGSVHKEQVEKFEENVLGYEFVTGRKVERKIIVTPLAFQDGREKANELGIEIISPPISYYYR